MKTTSYKLLFVLVVFLWSCGEEKKEEMKTTEVKAEVVEVKEKTIYEKLGGANGVSVLVDDIVAEHLKNEHIKHYFEPLKKDEAYFNQFKNHVKAFLAAGTGGSEQYSGRDMASAHQGLNLSADDFMHAIDDILIVLDRHNVDRASKNELLATLYSMKDAVMNQ